jgi:hypothetical protein
MTFAAACFKRFRPHAPSGPVKCPAYRFKHLTQSHVQGDAMAERKGTGKMTVAEAGQKGGQKVRKLIEAGERREEEKKATVRKR